MLLLVTLILGGAAVFYGLSSPSGLDAEKNKKTAAALEQAKAALLGAAVSVDINPSPPSLIRPGDLPCPDTNDDGLANDGSCGNGPGTTGQALRIGRLPWKTLGLPDIRDGDGERLWYALSNNFKNNTRTACTAAAPGAATCLNSDSRGTITVRDSAGNIVHDATNTDPANSGVIAVVFSPGAVLRRQDGTLQNRTCTGGAGCNTTGVCQGTPPTAPKCNSINYLDISGTEDNANFADGTTNGFVNGIVRDAGSNVIVNDRLIVITYQDLMPQLEKRVTGEVSKCLVAYANTNFQRYPWAAPVTDVTTLFSDSGNTLFGRIPDQPLLQSQLGTASVTPIVAAALQSACVAVIPSLCMSRRWPVVGCNLPFDPTDDSWWNNWKLHIFYGLADAYKPQIVFTQPIPGTVSLGSIASPTGCPPASPSCLTVAPPSAAADKKFVVIAAGRRLSGQLRTSTLNQQNPVNYLEGENTNDPIFTQQPGSPLFNDTVLYK